MNKKIISVFLCLTIVAGVTTATSKTAFAYDKATLQNTINENELTTVFKGKYTSFCEVEANWGISVRYYDKISSISQKKLEEIYSDVALGDILNKYIDLQSLYDFYTLEKARLEVEGNAIKQIATQELAKGNKLGANTILNTYNKNRQQELNSIEKYTNKSNDVYNNDTEDTELTKLMSNITDPDKRQFLYAHKEYSLFGYFSGYLTLEDTADKYQKQYAKGNFSINVPQTKAEADEYIKNNTFTLKDYIFTGYTDNGIPRYYSAYDTENSNYKNILELLTKIKNGSTDTTTINEAKTLISKLNNKEIKELYMSYITHSQPYKLNGYSQGIPIYTSTNSLINEQFKTTEKALKNMINNQDNYSLYGSTLDEINKLSDKTVKESYQKSLEKYWPMVATPYVRQILTKAAALQKDFNLYDRKNLFDLINNSPLKTKKDAKFNEDYLYKKYLNLPEFEITMSTDGCFVYQVIDELLSVPSKENIEHLKDLVKSVKHPKTVKWFKDKIATVENKYYNSKNSFTLAGYDGEVPIFTSKNAVKNKQFKTIEKDIKSFINNLDNFELHDIALQEINKLTDQAVKDLYLPVVESKLSMAKTPYVLNITDNLALFEKDKNLADYNRILYLINTSPIKEKRDDTYNKAYFTRVLYKSGQVAHLYNKESINAINLINKACKTPTKANIQAARNAVKSIKHPKTVKWLNDEITIIEKRATKKK